VNAYLLHTLKSEKGLELSANTATRSAECVMPALIPDECGIFDRHPVLTWIPAFAGMTMLRYYIAGVIEGLTFPETMSILSQEGYEIHQIFSRGLIWLLL
jgi:hypothetical protein